MSITDNELQPIVEMNVANALQEDIGSGDLTAALLPSDRDSSATVITREAMVLAGRPWFDEVYRQVDPDVHVTWRSADGERLEPGHSICALRGPARSLVSGERCALNFLQLMCATATVTAEYAAAVVGTGARILDTRKTVPGLRLAQKYAVRCGGGVNHRLGLFDAILIKENHILACGGIEPAIAAARRIHPDLPIEVEVETIDELRQALAVRCERILLDNFRIDDLDDAVRINRAEGNPPAILEASGGVTLAAVRRVAQTGVDFISIGAITKNVRSVDLSMRFD
ncbi:MAG TPA: carboxylating nicotinate-nucleotide diphosphorylase [Woeseiaceae bacterium]|nr:carboxylating nicotinate-nucleotide diphosphorylase [Woeseiaceae bacterium]